MSKRSYGQGSIFQRGKTWWVQYCVDGAVERESSHSGKRADAERLLHKRLGEKARGEISTAPNKLVPTVADLLKLRLVERSNGGSDPYIVATLVSLLGDKPVNKLRPADFAAYREARRSQVSRLGNNAKEDTTRLKARPISNTTIDRELGVLRAELRRLNRVNPDILPSVPHVPMEGQDVPRQGYITDAEFETKLYPQLPRHLRALTTCAFYCGGRSGEWLYLDWADIDFAGGRILFRKTKSKYPREVPIVPGLMEKVLAEQKAYHDLVCPDEPAVFTYDGKRIKVFKKAWATATRKAGMAGLIFHDLRRSANRGMRGRGVPQGVRMAIMGHRTTSHDIRYGIVDQADLEIARERMSANRGTISNPES